MTSERLEKRIVALLVAVQVFNILDFVMVMPLGPSLATGLGVATSRIGLVAGSYTAAAALSGAFCSLFLDRFDRRSALVICLVGLCGGTLACAFATGLPSLMAARVLAGLFGGPASRLCFSIISDVVPEERRGRAVGELVSAFSVASVVGVPLGLRLSTYESLGGWRAPFVAVGLLMLPMVVAARLWLPPLRGHLQAGAATLTVREELRDVVRLLGRPLIRSSLAMTVTAMVGAFTLIPNLATHVQRNLGYPADAMDKLYLVGGLASWVVSRFVVGRIVDRHGSLRAAVVGAAILVPLVLASFVPTRPLLPIVAIYALFMFGMGFRNVAFQTVATKVPLSHERARFQSLQSAINHCGTSAGAFLSTALLVDRPDGHVDGMWKVAAVFAALHLLLPLLIGRVEAGVRRQRAAVA